MSTKKNISDLIGSGRLRQVLERGYLSSAEIQYVIDAVYEKMDGKKKKKF